MVEGFLKMYGWQAQVMEMIGTCKDMLGEVEIASPEVAAESAEIIANEQRRIFNKAHFERDKPKHSYKKANSSLIQVRKYDRYTRSVRHRAVYFEIGFDTNTLRLYPELIEIEFGRPGKSPRYSGALDKNGRKKGLFPENAQVMPVRAGFQAAKEKAFKHYADRLLNSIR